MPDDRSAAVTSPRIAVRSWPLMVLAVPAAAEVWAGWVGIARLTGFGMVSPLPGIWPSLHLDTSVTLPVGVEAYAAYALRAWLAGEDAVSPRARRFARWSALLSLALGMAGQVTYHLLAGAGVTRAPWAITTIVSCLPVLVLAMGTTLAHLLRDDALAAQAARGPGVPDPPMAAKRSSARDRRAVIRTSGQDRRAEPSSTEQARLLAIRLATAGKPVSRRALRSGGIRGSNQALNRLAGKLNAELASRTAPTETLIT